MKKFFLFALALCCLASRAHAQASPPQNPAPGQPPQAANPAAPAAAVRPEPLKVIPDELFNHELKDLEGQSFSLSDYRGRVFVVNIWASWCGPCRLEIPHLNRVYEDYAPRGVEFVGLTTENSIDDARRVSEFARDFKMKYKVGWADSETARALMNGTSIPQTLVVAPDGHIVLRFRGYSDKVPQMLRDGIERALNPPPAAGAAPAPSAAPVAAPAPGRP